MTTDTKAKDRISRRIPASVDSALRRAAALRDLSVNDYLEIILLPVIQKDLQGMVDALRCGEGNVS
jgi:uncharacterized protein (DUF1778 family)